MFEVIVRHESGETETYDALTDLQAECIFFRARMKPNVQTVELNEVVEVPEINT